ncbi:MAG: PQQ-dependent sugar dehydrogenase [Chloroflexota bacterium]
MLDQKRLRIVLVVLVIVLMTGMTIGTQQPASAQSTAVGNLKIGLQPFLDGFDNPTGISNANDGSGRLFIVQKAGSIIIVRDGKKVATPFLDITSLIDSGQSERGLLSVAFHPKYKDNGLFFVYYTAPGGDVTIARYKVSSNPDVADPGSAKILLTQVHPRINHNGGQVMFGPDGYLYMGLGDGGGGGDPDRNGQNPKTLLGKLLRLDVDNGDPYGIPADNPFATNKAGGRPEVWAIGLRNPWRFSFDRGTGDLYIADVGQNDFEEVDVVKAGNTGLLNFGWNTTEGLHCYPAGAQCDQSKFIQPVAEYDHSLGCSISGGFVYRGAAYPVLRGTYFYSDYCSGRIWGLQQANGSWQSAILMQGAGSVSTFGEDEAGELYVADLSKGTISKLVAQG